MRRRLLPLTALFLAGAATLQAQQPAGVLTLEEALRIARERNPTFLRTANDLELAESGIRTAWGALLPSLSTQLGFSGSNSRRLSGEDDFGRPVEAPQVRTFQSSSASQGISTGMTLFDGGANLRSVQTQRALYEGVSAQIDAQANQLDAQVARDYYQAVKAVRNIALEEQLLGSAHERLTRTQELLRLAARNRGDVLGAREDVLTSEQALARARSDADRTRMMLAATLGLAPAAPITLDTIVPRAFDPAELNVDALVARALVGSPTVRQREAAVRAARHQRQAANARRLPTISANASYGRSMSTSGYGAFGQFNPQQNASYGFGMSVSLPLFTRFQTSDAVLRSSAAERDAEFDLQAARLIAERDVRAAVIELNSAYQALQLADERAALSRERQELSLEQYRLGAIDFTVLQSIIDRTAQAERQALDARFSFITARINLEERLGSRLEG